MLDFGPFHQSPWIHHLASTYQARHATFTGREVEGIYFLTYLFVSL